MPFDKVYLKNPIFNKKYQQELKEIDKHEIIAKISDIIGPCPSHLSCAEQILEDLKFDIAKYVLHHEYGQENEILSKLLLWCDCKTSPNCEKKLNNFINEYLKK